LSITEPPHTVPLYGYPATFCAVQPWVSAAVLSSKRGCFSGYAPQAATSIDAAIGTMSAHRVIMDLLLRLCGPS
jgi:hypothetical protein